MVLGERLLIILLSAKRGGERRVVNTYRKQSKKVYSTNHDEFSRMSDDESEKNEWMRDEKTRVEWREFTIKFSLREKSAKSLRKARLENTSSIFLIPFFFPREIMLLNVNLL